MRIERGGSISTEITKRPSAEPGEERGGRRRLEAAVGGRRWRRGRGRRSRRSRSRRRRPRSSPSTSRRGRRRIAAMCSGVVPQQPPTIAAPASSSRGDHRAEVRRARPRRRTGPRSAAAGRRWGSIERAGCRVPGAHRLERLEAGLRPGAAVDADDVDRRAARSAAAAAGVVPSASSRSSPNVSWATIGRSAVARRASSTAISRCRRSRTSRARGGRRHPRAGRRSARGTRRGSAPRRAGARVARRARPAGRPSRATSASRPATSRASRATLGGRAG